MEKFEENKDLRTSKKRHQTWESFFFPLNWGFTRNKQTLSGFY